MEIIILKNEDVVAEYSAQIIIDLINKKPRSVLGLASGATPIKLYQLLVKNCQEGNVSFKKVKTFNLDDYIGLCMDHQHGFKTYMQENLFKYVDINPKNTFLPNVHHKNLLKACQEYEKKIKSKGGIDLQILGIGTNGHIGFNEPGSSLTSRTNIKALAPLTIKTHKNTFKKEKCSPVMGITMGIGTIMDAKEIMILATGAKKADAVAKAVEGPLSSMCPASILQTHNNVKFIIDEKAAVKLKLKKYYKDSYQLQLELLKNTP